MDKLVTIRLEFTCEAAGFPYGCYLVGIRDIDDIDKDSE